MLEFFLHGHRVQAAEIAELGSSEHLYALACKVVVKSGKRQARPVDCRFADLSVQSA